LAGHGSKIGQKREEAIAALLSCPSVPAAAKRAGIPERTLYRWLARDEGFREDYRQARRAVVDQAVGILQRATGAAAVTLVNSLRAEKDSDCIRAAALIFEVQRRETETQEILARIEALEARE
jgi:hypothetical protein